MFLNSKLSKTILASTVILVSSFSLFASFNSLKVQAGAGNAVNLLVNSKTSTDGVNWQNEQISKNGQYTTWNCGSQTFVGDESKMPQMKGISDFDDGINLKNKAQTTNSQAQILNTQRDCENYNVKSNGQPVFAYQYSFEYKFPADKKASESARYRVHTYQNGDYDGVLYTFTYYNYWNPQKNTWNGWENPNKSNELNGFLAYAIKSEMGVPKRVGLPNPDQQQETKFVGKIGNNEIEMNLIDLEIGLVVMGNSGKKVGTYKYSDQDKFLEIRKTQKQIGNTFAVLEEFDDNRQTGNFNVASFDKNIMKGNWTNAKTGEKLPFEVKRVESSSASSQGQNNSQNNIQTLNGNALEMQATGPDGEFAMMQLDLDDSREDWYYFPKEELTKFNKAKNSVVWGKDAFMVWGKAKLESVKDGRFNWKMTQVDKVQVYKMNGENSSQNNSKEIQPLVADEFHDVVVIEECDLAVRFKKSDSFVKNNRIVKRDYNGEIYSIENDSAYNDEKGNAIPVSLFNVRCQKGKSFNDFIKQSIKTLPFPEIENIEQSQRVGYILSVINGEIETRKDKNTIYESYLDNNITPGIAAFKLKNSDINVLMIGNKDTNLDIIQAIQQNSLAPSIASVKFGTQATSPENTSIKLFTTTKNSNQCSEVKSKTITIPKTQAVATETAKKLFTDKDSFFNGFDKYLKKVERSGEIIYIDLDKSVMNDPKWGTLNSSCGFGYHNEITQTMTQWGNNAAFFRIDGKVQTFQIGDQNADVFWVGRG